ncbi:MAG: TetR/AcrR family transcriptional regulator [Kurthia sp.]|nr:TetR/AcrR family transcriptional regulator [Candidatus Kurthia equi]
MTKAKGENTYQKMIDVAIYLFAKDGIHNTSFSKIAKALNMTKPSLYYYVDSKEELVAKVFDYIYEDYVFSSYFEDKKLVAKDVASYLIEGGLQFIEEVDEDGSILNLLQEFTLYANRQKETKPYFFGKMQYSKQSFVKGFEKSLLLAGVDKKQVLQRAQTLALMLANIQSYKKIDENLDEATLWTFTVKNAIKE